MLRENQFIRIASEGKSEQEIYQLREQYRRLPKKLKKKYDQNYVKLKKTLPFEEWAKFVLNNARQGRAQHEKNKDNVIRDPKSIKLAEDSFKSSKEYLKLK